MIRTIVFFLLYMFVAPINGDAQIHSIRIAHFNIGQLSMGKKDHSTITQRIRNQKLKEFQCLFEKISPDIICFCEFPQTFTMLHDSTENINDPAEKAFLKDYVFFYKGNKDGKRCNAIASRKLILSNAKTINFSVPQRREFVLTTFEMCGKQVKLVECHLEVPKFQERRDIQIKELIRTFKFDEYVIICGDFNVSKTSEYNIFKENGYKMANHGIFGDMITHPRKDGGGTAIDNIICKGFDVVGVQLFDLGLSDHCIITSDLIIKL